MVVLPKSLYKIEIMNFYKPLIALMLCAFVAQASPVNANLNGYASARKLEVAANANNAPAAEITGPANACVNSILTFKGNGTENNGHYVWAVDDATVIYGAGTNEIQLKFTTAGTKTITLQFQDSKGEMSSLAEITVVVATLPAFSALTAPSVCAGTEFVNTAPTVTGTYITGSEFWSLDGVEIPSDYKWAFTDNGKLLQYNVRTTGCDVVSSAGVTAVVKQAPAITSVTNLPAVLCKDEQLNAAVTAKDNGSTITAYEWWIEDTKVGDDAGLSYTFTTADDGKTVKVKAINACGADSSTNTLAITTVNQTTPVHDSVKAVSPIPEGFMIQPVTTETKRELPEKYWENTAYRFITTANTEHSSLVNGSTIYLERGSDGVWSIPNDQSGTVGYMATVQKVTALRNMTNPTNTTIIIDKGSIAMGISTALQFDGLKIFGLGEWGNSIIEGQTNESNYIRKKNMVLENLVYDGINFARNTHFFRVQDDGANTTLRGGGGSFLIVKNLAIRNVNIKGGGTLNMSPRGIFNIDDNNAYYEDGATDAPGTAVYEPSYNITERYFINVTIESSCVLANSYAYPVYVNSSRYDYIENLNVQMTTTTYPVWIMQARNNSTEVSNSSGQVPTGITINGLTSVNDGIFVHMYQSKNITLPNGYRYLQFRTSNGSVGSTSPSSGTAVTAYKALPATSSSYAYYDRNDGYWILRDGASRTLSQQLTDLRTIYNLNVTNKTPLPSLNIKVIKNSSGTINGFTVPDFGKMPVHIVAVSDINTPVDKAGTIIPYSGSTALILTAANAPYVNFSNLDFTQNVGYYLASINSKVSNSLPGNFYHCKFLYEIFEAEEPLTLTASNILPLTLLQFSGKTNFSGNLLTWETANELNVSRFEIEYSADAHHFEKVGTVAASGNSESKKPYSFIHQPINASPVAAYRLKMIDIDGAYTYSPVVQLIQSNACNNAGFEIVSVSPVPFSDNMVIRYCAGSNVNMDAVVYDMSGKVVAKREVALSKGQGAFSIGNLSALAKGSYIVRIQDEKGNYVIRKVMKQ